MISYDVAPGVHAIVHGHTNCFVVEDNAGVTLVDAGYPSTWLMVEQCLHAIGWGPDAVQALLITHGHFDHLGFANLVQQRYGVPVWAHPADLAITQHPYRYRPEKPRLLYPLAYPRAVPVLTAMVAAGALAVPGVTPDRHLSPGLMDLPGRPVIIHTPGHTDGACVVLLSDRDAILTGDTLVTLDPYTGLRGPRVVARAATNDGRLALDSVRGLSSVDATHVLPGHGEMWQHGMAAAAERAQAPR